MPLTFAPLSLDDLPALAALHAACFEGGERWSEDQLRGSLALPTTRGAAAWRDGRIAGFLLAQQAGGEIEILTLCVDPSRRRQGIGKQLLQTVLSGEGPVFLEVAADNGPARRLYEQGGFAAFGVRPGYYVRAGGTVDAVMYRREKVK